MKELLQCKVQHPDARIIGGNTEVGIEMNLKGAAYPVLIDATRVPELQVLEEADGTSLLVCRLASLPVTTHWVMHGDYQCMCAQGACKHLCSGLVAHMEISVSTVLQIPAGIVKICAWCRLVVE
jgi:FAD binding domain in molybdopterin dehydrogenase